jgi:hypothetical protein
MPGCAMPCKAANTYRLWQAGTSGLAFPVEMSHHIDTPATCWLTTWREADLLAACVSSQRCCVAAIAEKFISAAQAGGTLAVRLFSPARVSSNQVLLSGPAVWVLGGPAVRQLSGPAVWAPTGPPVW